MMRSRRTYTFSWFTFWPRWRSYHFTPKPVNWLLFRWYDWLPLAVVLAVPAGLGGVAAAVGAGWYFAIFPLVFLRRLHGRRRHCAAHGHTPHEPLPGEWECLYCGAPLSVESDPQVVATSVAHAASEIDLARRPQSYWSDRR